MITTTEDLLACITTGAIDYIQKTVNPNSKVDYRQLKKLFDDQRFEAKSFDDTELDILTFDWQSPKCDRNWWWQLQALPFLNWYANSLELQSEAERARYFSLCIAAIDRWVSRARQNTESPLAWHDHAAAFRVRNLANWLVFCHAAGLPVRDAEAVGSLISDHLEWLQDDKNYSKNTNHGFDQAMIALTIGMMFGNDIYEPYRKRNRDRLVQEMAFAFTDEGVHKENSPGYQKMMLGRLRQLRCLASLGDEKVVGMAESYIGKAESFLRAITLANGFLPMIGDTRGGDQGLRYEQKGPVDVLDYSASGYVVVRGCDGLGKPFFILLKNTHESNYHRHDDDMMIYVYYDGEIVLGDGGLYKHQEKDKKRIRLRSYLSHSVPYISREAIRDRRRLPGLPAITRNGETTFKMESRMFGVLLTRYVAVDCSSRLKIKVTDCSYGVEESSLWSNFFFERRLPLLFGENGVTCMFPSFSFCIRPSRSGPMVVDAGWREPEGGACVSTEYGSCMDALRIAFNSTSHTLEFREAV